MLFEQVKSIIEENIKESQVQVYDLTGGGDHLGITIISDEFKGKMLLAQHRMVMDILKQKLSEDLHAVQLKTLTVEQAKNQGLV